MLTVLKDRRRGPPGILVLAPTRELACQIEEECVKFGRSSNIRSICAYGGAPKSLQVRKIQGGIEVLIATPGRLNDLLEMRVVDLTQVVFLGKFISIFLILFFTFMLYVLIINFDEICVLLLSTLNAI
jgi:superfamily II DNA/RNA helicase